MAARWGSVNYTSVDYTATISIGFADSCIKKMTSYHPGSTGQEVIFIFT
jgi:hypothetical protein